ncbi:putative prophage L54a, portal protein, HK97 family [Trichinella spiralis]|uniref:putative prophage L54a, portal protein, HK97 family n=1 Tax=Trichinella spiralis TaxID=6334 RepID=UPI0001EFEF2D|nr:putative prophage L54a, portal protein, HK97 family [Trichinella spiralis]
MPPGKYLSSPDSFYQSHFGSFVVKNKRQKITDFVKKAYFAYFGTVPQGPDVPIPSPPDSMDAVVLSDEEKHMRQMCGDFKVLCVLLGQQSVNTKFPCFVCNGIAEHVMNTGRRKTGQCKQTLHQRQKTFAIKV